MKNLITVVFVVGLYLIMFAIMVINNGWAMAGFMTAILAAPFVVFGLIPRLLQGPVAGGRSNEKGYFYGYKYKFGAKPPKF